MTTATDISIRSLIREVAASSDATSYREMAAEVMAKVADEDLRSILAQVMPDVVGTVLRLSVAAIRVDDDEDGDAADKQAARVKRGAGNQAPSKWSGPNGVGAVYMRYLNAYVSVGDKKIKRFGECEDADLAVMVAIRFDAATATHIEAQRLTKFREALKKAKATKVSELPESVVTEIRRWHP